MGPRGECQGRSAWVRAPGGKGTRSCAARGGAGPGPPRSDMQRAQSSHMCESGQASKAQPTPSGLHTVSVLFRTKPDVGRAIPIPVPSARPLRVLGAARSRRRGHASSAFIPRAQPRSTRGLRGKGGLPQPPPGKQRVPAAPSAGSPVPAARREKREACGPRAGLREARCPPLAGVALQGPAGTWLSFYQRKRERERRGTSGGPAPPCPLLSHWRARRQLCLPGVPGGLHQVWSSDRSHELQHL